MLNKFVLLNYLLYLYVVIKKNTLNFTVMETLNIIQAKKMMSILSCNVSNGHLALINLINDCKNDYIAPELARRMSKDIILTVKNDMERYNKIAKLANDDASKLIYNYIDIDIDSISRFFN